MTRGRSKTVTDDEIVARLREWPRDGKLPSTSNLKESVNDAYGAGYDRKTVYRRLDSLESDGQIEKIEVGSGRGRSIGWYHPDEFYAGDPPEEPATSSPAGEPMASGGMVTVAPENPAGYASSVGPIYFEDRFGLHRKLSLLMVGLLSIASLVSFGGWVATSSGELLIIALLALALAALGVVALFVLYNSRVFDRLGAWAQLRIKRLRRAFK